MRAASTTSRSPTACPWSTIPRRPFARPLRAPGAGRHPARRRFRRHGGSAGLVPPRDDGLAGPVPRALSAGGGGHAAASWPQSGESGMSFSRRLLADMPCCSVSDLPWARVDTRRGLMLAAAPRVAEEAAHGGVSHPRRASTCAGKRVLVRVDFNVPMQDGRGDRRHAHRARLRDAGGAGRQGRQGRRALAFRPAQGQAPRAR